MPGIATHCIFGLETYQELALVVGGGRCERDAFLLGNQGPDPLYYLVTRPGGLQFNKLGSSMHRARTAALLHAVHDLFIAPSLAENTVVRAPDASAALSICAPSDPANTHSCAPDSPASPSNLATNQTENAVARAYGLGFLCHYLLDSTVHPLVYAQQDAICRADITGMVGQRAQRAIHATIETVLDEDVLTTHKSTTARKAAIHLSALPGQPSDLSALSSRFATLAQRVYETSAPDQMFHTAVNLNRAGQALLDARGPALRRVVGQFRRYGLLNTYLLTLAHENAPRFASVFANNDHVPWPEPDAGEGVVSESFDELYDKAFQRAREVIPAFGSADFGLDRCEELVGGINFLGKPQQ